jgi:flagellar motor switch/type III secretory pathway protein FliN
MAGTRQQQQQQQQQQNKKQQPPKGRSQPSRRAKAEPEADEARATRGGEGKGKQAQQQPQQQQNKKRPAATLEAEPCYRPQTSEIEKRRLQVADELGKVEQQVRRLRTLRYNDVLHFWYYEWTRDITCCARHN